MIISLKRFKKSLIYARRGIFKAYKEEQNLQVQLKIAIIVLVLTLFADISKVELLLLVFAIAMVIIAELANSVVERVVDILKPRLSESAKEIKDIMAGIVLIASIVSVIIGSMIFFI